MEQTTLQQGLNNVVINKVQRMIENKQEGVGETMQRLAYEGQIAQDYIAPVGVELRQKEHAPVILTGSTCRDSCNKGSLFFLT